MIKIEKNQVFSTEGKFVHRTGSDTYFKRGTMLMTDTEADFEEVEEIPPYTKSEYDAKVAELVRERYSDSEESAIQRKMLGAMLHPEAVTIAEGMEEPMEVAEFNEYNAFVTECKERAKDPGLYRRGEV